MIRHLIAAALLALPAAGAMAQAPAAADSTTTAAGTALGVLIHEQVQAWERGGITVDPEEFCRVFTLSFLGQDTGMSPEQANAYMQGLFARKHREAEEQASREAEARAVESKAFVDAAAAQEGAVTTPSGLVFQVITEGEGLNPGPGQTVIVNYEGRLPDGTVFDGNLGQGPVEFGVSDLIPGFTEGLQLMKPGGTYRLVIPPQLGYGMEGIPGVIPGGSALDFTVQLQGIKD